MKIIYIASPYTKGDVAVNVRNQFLAAEKVFSLGFLPYPPIYAHFWHYLSPHPYEFWTKLDLEWVQKCDAVLRLPGESAGADEEVELADGLDIPVFDSLEELAEYFDFKEEEII